MAENYSLMLRPTTGSIQFAVAAMSDLSSTQINLIAKWQQRLAPEVDRESRFIGQAVNMD